VTGGSSQLPTPHTPLPTCTKHCAPAHPTRSAEQKLCARTHMYTGRQGSPRSARRRGASCDDTVVFQAGHNSRWDLLLDTKRKPPATLNASDWRSHVVVASLLLSATHDSPSPLDESGTPPPRLAGFCKAFLPVLRLSVLSKKSVTVISSSLTTHSSPAKKSRLSFFSLGSRGRKQAL